VPTAVQALLIETKQLLDSLRKWSVGQSTETDVSDVYVRLGTDFNKATRAFGYFGIDMTWVVHFVLRNRLPLCDHDFFSPPSDLQGVPENLRGVLEQCLGEDQTPQTLAVFMPEVRQILYTLLQGLQARQPLWKTASRTAPYRS
jgi:hypothetical protein